MADDLDFAVDLSGIDTQALMKDALWRVDALEGHLGEEGTQPQPGPAGSLMRSMDEDIAEFAAHPVVYRIEEDDFVKRDGTVPEEFRRLSEHNRFFRIEFPVNLFPRSSWSFDRLEVRLEFNPGGDGPTRPKAFQVFPNRLLSDLAHWKYGVTVQLNSDLKFAAAVPAAATGVGAGADAKANATAELAIGPFDYYLKRVVIETSQPGLEKVFWRLDDAKSLQEASPRFVVLTQIPLAATEATVVGALQAYRNYNFLADRVRNTFKELPKAIRAFFQNGAPISAQATYDLSPECIVRSAEDG